MCRSTWRSARGTAAAPFALATVMGVSLACGNKLADAPRLSDCTGSTCGPTPGHPTQNVDAGISAPVDAAEPSSDASVPVTFSVAALADTFFFTPSVYSSPVLVSAIGQNGNIVRTSDAGISSSGVLDGVTPGLTWFAVQDATGTFAVAPTLQPLLVNPNDLAVVLHVIKRDALDQVFVDGAPWVRTAGQANAIIVFLRNGRPASGVTVTNVPAGAEVAYDRAPPDYTLLTDVTDQAGVVLVRDIAVPTVFPALTAVSLRYRAGTQTIPFEVRLARDFITWVEVTLSN